MIPIINYFTRRKLQKLVLSGYIQAIEYVICNKDNYSEYKNNTEDKALKEIKIWLKKRSLAWGICEYVKYVKMLKFKTNNTIFSIKFYVSNIRWRNNEKQTGYFYKIPYHCNTVDEIIECLSYRKDLIERELEQNSPSTKLKNLLTR